MSSAIEGILGSLLGGKSGGSSSGGSGGGGLLGSLSGALGGNLVSQLAPAVIGMLAGGGLSKILAQFNTAGLGNHASSWVSKGENEPISVDQLKQALTTDQIDEVAGKLGVSHDDAANVLAQALPQVIDHVTPDGDVPHHSIIDQLLNG